MEGVLEIRYLIKLHLLCCHTSKIQIDIHVLVRKKTSIAPLQLHFGRQAFSESLNIAPSSDVDTLLTDGERNADRLDLPIL
jgi:hypothetical protein